MKAILTLCLMAFAASTHAKMVDGSYVCKFDNGAGHAVIIRPDGVEIPAILSSNLKFTSTWQPLDARPDMKGSYKAERFEKAILISIELENEYDKVISQTAITHKDGSPVELLINAVVISKLSGDFESDTHRAQCEL